MEIVNRIKVVLVEKGKTGKWLAKNMQCSELYSNCIYPDSINLDKIA